MRVRKKAKYRLKYFTIFPWYRYRRIGSLIGSYSVNTYEQKIEAKKERYKGLAEKNKRESDVRYNTAHKMSGAIPFGQPILIGHHSEKADRNYRKRMRSNLDKSIEADKSDDPDAVVKLKEKLAKLESNQEKFKAINRAIKKNDDEALKNRGLDENQIIEIKKPDYTGRVGIAGYVLTNNNANIRRIRERIEQLEKGQNDVTTTWNVGDIKVADSVEENRLQVFFPSKPDNETRKRLKRGGFRWSPTNLCWQRHRGHSARSSFDYILKQGVGYVQ